MLREFTLRELTSSLPVFYGAKERLFYFAGLELLNLIPSDDQVMSVLKYLFPVPKDSSRRVTSFTNLEDWILFRQHAFKKVNKDFEMIEIGPRFSMKCEY